MTFTNKEKTKALAIVNIFETSRPFDDYASCAVLNDGAGVSYGIAQFTHKSGSLAAVVETYLNSGGKIGMEILTTSLTVLKQKSVSAINALASDEQFKKALRAAAVTREMKAAQQHVMTEKYLQPALKTCAEFGFVLPLSLAVIFDSLIHGSWEKIRRNAGILPACDSRAGYPRSDNNREKELVTAYVRERHAWLLSIPRLKATSYRTKFFLGQIKIGNWNLRLPVNVHGFRLTEDFLPSETVSKPGAIAAGSSVSEPGAVATGSVLNKAGEIIKAAAEKFDRVDHVVATVTSRKDAAKSLWTTIIGTLWQTLWAIFGFVAGLPREVWIVVAVIAALLMLLYLYRQIELGKIRETNY